MLTEYNRRQFERILDSLDRYEEGRSSLSTLVSNIEGLLGALEDFAASARDEFSRRWGVLDEVLAVSLDEGERELNSEELDLVRRAIRELRALCEQTLSQQQGKS
jgi:hypothetical protein